MLSSLDRERGAATTPPVVAHPLDRVELLEQFRAVRALSTWICEPLAAEDMIPQSMPDASPIKWHLAHTTWFFETFVLREARPGDPDHHPAFNYLFNSYYNGIGAQFARPMRGLVTRPTVADVAEYRAHTDDRIAAFVHDATKEEWGAFGPVIELGIHHEQQHQELMLTDLRHLLAHNPLRPVYRARRSNGHQPDAEPLEWIAFDGGLIEIGHEGGGFSYDNERPRHKAYLQRYHLANRPVTCGEWLSFMADGGYEEPSHWLSAGWATVQGEGWKAPLYWVRSGEGWEMFTLHGPEPMDPAAPVVNVSFYEADAYARWVGARLPTEAEWEVACIAHPSRGALLEEGTLQPPPNGTGSGLTTMLGGVWEWTASPYTGYPGYRAAEGSIGEYNGKFMCDQHVLRGGSVATPASHIRATYRNFFPAHARWQFSGVRLARDA